MNPESPRKNHRIEILPGDDETTILRQLCSMAEMGSVVLVSGNREIETNKESLLSLFDNLLVDSGEYVIMELPPGDDAANIPEGSTIAEEKEDVYIADRSLRSLSELLAAVGRKWDVQVDMNGEKFRLSRPLFLRAKKIFLGE